MGQLISKTSKGGRLTNGKLSYKKGETGYVGYGTMLISGTAEEEEPVVMNAYLIAGQPTIVFVEFEGTPTATDFKDGVQIIISGNDTNLLFVADGSVYGQGDNVKAYIVSTTMLSTDNVDWVYQEFLGSTEVDGVPLEDATLRAVNNL